MSNINDTLAKLEFAQIGWVVPDINAAVKFLSMSLGDRTGKRRATPAVFRR